MFWKVYLWNLKFLGQGYWTRPNCISWVKSRDVLFPKLHQEASTHGADPVNTDAWSRHNTRSLFVILPTVLRSQGQARLFKLAPTLLTLQGSPSELLLCRCQKDLRLFSLAKKRAPFGFQAVPLKLCKLGGELNVGSSWDTLQPLAGLPPDLERHQAHNLLGSVYFSFAKVLLNWLGHLHNT